jgi:hypothetical protein
MIEIEFDSIRVKTGLIYMEWNALIDTLPNSNEYGT